MCDKIIEALENNHRLYYKIKNKEEAEAIAYLLAVKGYFESKNDFLELYSENCNCLILMVSSTSERKKHFLVEQKVAIDVGNREYKPIETIINPTYDDLAPIFSDVDASIKIDIAQEYDTVERPEHYNVFDKEVIHTIKDLLDNNKNYKGFESYCIGNILKYIFRAGMKNDFYEDLEKARYYINKILEGEEIDE